MLNIVNILLIIVNKYLSPNGYGAIIKKMNCKYPTFSGIAKTRCIANVIHELQNHDQLSQRFSTTNHDSCSARHSIIHFFSIASQSYRYVLLSTQRAHAADFLLDFEFLDFCSPHACTPNVSIYSRASAAFDVDDVPPKAGLREHLGTSSGVHDLNSIVA